MVVSFENSFLLDFKFSKEAFCVYNGRLYIIQETNGHFDGNNFLSLNGEKFAIRESETISNLEAVYFNLNREEIEKLMNDIITSRFINKLKESEKNLLEGIDYYSSIQAPSIESLLKEEVVNYYKQYVLEDLSKVQDRTKELDINVNNFNKSDITDPKIDDLKSESNSLIDLLQDRRVLVIGERCYNLIEDKSSQDTSEYIIINGESFNIKRGYYVDELEKRYLDKLMSLFETKAIEHGQKLIPKINQNLEQLANLEKVKKEERSDEWDFGSIGYTKKRDDSYEVYIRIEPYIIKEKGRYFKFKSVKVGTHIGVKSNAIYIMNEPKVLESSRYHHMFVMKDNTICYGHTGDRKTRNRWYYKGIKFGELYSLGSSETREKAALAIALILSEGWNIIHWGYPRDPYNLINYIPDNLLSQEISEEDASRSGLITYDNDNFKELFKKNDSTTNSNM